MFSLEQPEELIKMRLILSLNNNQINSQKEIEQLFSISPPDIVVVDQNQEIALLVDIQIKQDKSEVKPGELSKLTRQYLQNTNNEKDIRFVMLANLENIAIFKSNSDNFSKPIVSLNTANILSHYDPKFTEKRILYLYFRTLIEAWLRDLAYGWKSETPPGSEELAKIGLLEKIKDGDTYTQNE